MCANFTIRALSFIWIPVIFMCCVASAQVSKMSEEEQIKRLNHARSECWKNMTTHPYELTGLFCNRTWDNIMCWPDTAAGTVLHQPCPAYINGFDHAEYAVKHCLKNGTWFVLPNSDQPSWTNFTACYSPNANKKALPALIVEHMPGIKLMYTIGYSLSLAALIMAVTIMLYFRRLHCPRNMIHLNMFVAFLMRAAFSLMKNVLLVNDLGFPNDVNNTGHRIEFIDGTHWECKLFFTLFYYVIFASLMGLFNEGLYLVLILSVSVFAEKTKVRWFILLGWGVPVIFVVPWVICRIHFDDMLCWNVHEREEYFWILRGPWTASVVVNFLFFVNIVRLLFTKLTASNCPESKKVRYRKLAKSTLILIPLFAVYYMGFIWLPDGISPASDLFKLYVEMLFNSFQGFLVALLFCFLNAEVQGEIRKEWHRKIARSGSWRSQPSIGSFLHRSAVHKNGGGGGHHHRNSHSRSFLDSDTTHSVGLCNSHSPPKAANGHLGPISEETTPLNGSSGRMTSIQMYVRQGYSDDRKEDGCCPGDYNDDDNVKESHNVAGCRDDVLPESCDETGCNPDVTLACDGDFDTFCGGDAMKDTVDTGMCSDVERNEEELLKHNSRISS